MDLFDTHCHIQSSDQQTGADGEAVTRSLWAKAGYPAGSDIIERAAQYGVNRMICVGCSLPDSQRAVDFVQSCKGSKNEAENRANIWASIGIHPHEAQGYVVADATGSLKLEPVQTTLFTALADNTSVIAIGECGLDYFYEHSDPASQAIILKFQIELALAHDLPLIFHVREAFDDFWPILDSLSSPQRPIRGVLHSFTDTQPNLDKALERGLYIGVNGIATFTKSSAQLEMYKNIPLSRLLLETDSPFLTPYPYRGTICEPYHTSVTAEFLVNLRNMSLSELAAATTVNGRQLFQV